MRFFIETFKPELKDGNPVKRDVGTESEFAKMDPRVIWSEIQLDTTCITNGFLSASADNRVQGYYLCEKPCEDQEFSHTLFTEILSECGECAGEGEVEGGECNGCEGQGAVYRYLNEIWPGL